MNNIHSKDQLRLIDFQYVLEVHRKQNISLAADALGTTQSAVSYAIKRVESAYGLTLFERKNRGVKSLPSTYKFVKELEQILNSSERLTAISINSLAQSISTIRIGICRLYERYYTTPLINALARSFPDLNVQISSGHFQELYTFLLGKKTDVIFTPILHPIPGLMPIPLFTDKLLFIAPSDSVIPTENTVPTETDHFLFSSTIVLPRESSQLHSLCSELLERYFHGPYTVAEADSFYTVASYAKTRIGGGFIPASILPRLDLDQHIRTLDFPAQYSSYPVGALVKNRDTLIASAMKQLAISDISIGCARE